MRNVISKGQTYLRTAGDFLNERAWLRGLLVFSFFFVLFAYIYLPDTIMSANDDHFFHFRFAEHMRRVGFFGAFDQFKSIYFSHAAQGAYYPYYNFLFYLAVLPFTYITPLYLGIKLYAVCAAALFFTALYLAVRSFSIPHSFLWIVGLFSLMATHSVWRLFLSRPYVLAPIILVAIIVALHKRQWPTAAVLSFLYFFWYDATFFFPFGVALVHAAFVELYTHKRDLNGVTAVAVGTLAALVTVYVLAPGFLAFIAGVISAAAMAPFRGVSMPVGGEVYPIDIIVYIQSNAILFALLLVGLGMELYHYRTQRRDSYANAIALESSFRASLLFLVFGFLAAGSITTGRFIDYVYPFMAMYIILSLHALARHLREATRPFRTYVASGLMLALLFLALTASVSLDTFMSQVGNPAQVFEGIGGWLAEHTDAHTVIFNADWSWFPQLYYYSPDNYYVTGLDPHFLYDFDERKYWLWSNIVSRGYVCEREDCPDLEAGALAAGASNKTALQWRRQMGSAIADVLQEDFKAEYVVTSDYFVRLNEVLTASSRFKKVYGGARYYQIYQVVP